MQHTLHLHHLHITVTVGLGHNPRHLSSSCICRRPCDADVSQLRRTRWAPNERKALRSTQLPCCCTICL